MYLINVKLNIPKYSQTYTNKINRIEKCNLDCQNSKNQQDFESCVEKCANKVLTTFPTETNELLSKLSALH